MKLDKRPCMIYADLEPLIKKIYGCANNPEKSSFDNIGNKHSLYRGEDCMKKFCISLKEHAANVIKFQKKKMLPLTE